MYQADRNSFVGYAVKPRIPIFFVHLPQVSPYSRVPEIEISRSPDGLMQVGMMPNLASLHYGDYGVLTVSPYQPTGELQAVFPFLPYLALVALFCSF